MKQTYLYLSTLPEALIASMLPPLEFGVYLAVGPEKRARDEAMFFDLKPGFAGDFFDLKRLEARLTPHADGKPRRSLYLGIYRVLEHVPLTAINRLHLVTRDGRMLELQQSPLPARFEGKYHLYSELCPVYPLVVSSLNPVEFCRFITDPQVPIHVPRICFVEIELGALAENPRAARPVDAHTMHIRDCVLQLETQGKRTKTVDRTHQVAGWGLRVCNGFYVGDREGMIYFPFPSPEDMEIRHHDWWRSAWV
jgi:hypothetical protein